MNEPEQQVPQNAENFLTPASFIRAAQAVHPAFKYAILVAGVLAIVVTFVRFGVGYPALVFGSIALIGLMVLFLVFAQASKLTRSTLDRPALVLIWSMLLISIAIVLLLTGSVFFNYPLPFREWIIEQSMKKTVVPPVETPAAADNHPAIPKQGISATKVIEQSITKKVVPPVTPLAIADNSATIQTQRINATKAKVNSKDGQSYVWIPSGSFVMGCSLDDDAECFPNELPWHNVKISQGFWMGQTEVTQAAYLRLIGVNPSYFRMPQLPVENVTFDDAKNYCEAAGGRLPTEAEWEYAARAGSTTSRYGDLDEIAWYQKNSGSHTHKVGQKLPNAWNLYDMLGNALEWVGDWFDQDYYKQSPSEDPKGPATGTYRVVRGGSWVYGSVAQRASYRGEGNTKYAYLSFGFRCVLNEFPLPPEQN